MQVIKTSYDPFLKKDVKKIRYKNLPKIKIFNKSDIAIGNTFSNLAIAFVYTWRKDKPPKKIRELFHKVANYSAITGYWRTTNGAKYAFSNILANPNINKLLILIFNSEDNGHLLVDALVNFWTKGINKRGIINGTKAANPRLEGIPVEALKRIKKQVDLLVCKNANPNLVEKLVKGAIQEPKSATNLKDIEAEFYSETIKNGKLYDDGCRFEKPLHISLSSNIKNVEKHQETKHKTIGGSLHSKNLNDAFQKLISFISKYGTTISDQRGIKTKECRSLTIAISNPLKNIPKGFSKDYLKRYTKEFIDGIDSKDFSYTYHNRIFKRWGNQSNKMIKILKKNNNTRRALISLWDPSCDISDSNSPCLDLIWAVIRNKKLEFHALYRSHHIATITGKGNILMGEGAFIPNIYALAVMQKHVAKKLNLKAGRLAVTDLSSHVYVSGAK